MTGGRECNKKGKRVSGEGLPVGKTVKTEEKGGIVCDRRGALLM